MAKVCIYPGCKYGQFGGKYCKIHQWKRDDVVKETKKVSDKMAEALVVYGERSKEFLLQHEECNIKSPVCTFFSGCVNHTRGRETVEQLLNEEDWEAACWSCNGYIEENHEWAEQRGHKKKRHGHYKRVK